MLFYDKMFPEGTGRLVIAFLTLLTHVSHAQDVWSDDSGAGERCPRLYPKKFIGHTPIGNLTAGNYTEQPGLKVLRGCIVGCCRSATCNAVLAVDDKCYHVECYSDELCMPQLRTSSAGVAHTAMVLVRPVLPDETWDDILANYQASGRGGGGYQARGEPVDELEGEAPALSRYAELPGVSEALSRRLLRPHDYIDPADLPLDLADYVGKVCEVGADDECPAHARCEPVRARSRQGACRCRAGWRPAGGGCAPAFTKDSAEEPQAAESAREAVAVPASVEKLIVSVASKKIELPENKVTLSAFTIPDEKTSDAHYSYAWTLVDQPSGGFTGNMNQNGDTMTLTDLTEGQYRFKVAVNGTTRYGEGFANVTVLPAARTNTPPRVVITPAAQTVKPPTSGAVLDGSASKDDAGIVSYHWEVVSAPIGYQPRLEEGATLELHDLVQPGNYTFKLTVEDTDGVKNFTTANITVLSHTDYPPEANAGQDVIVYLPNNSLTLNGSLSTDDHEITSWEWTKAAGDEDKAVDMQNTHSPFLQLSNLSEGVYAFVLKVTDSSGQYSTAKVHVFVKPPADSPLVAVAGDPQVIPLPRTWATLNGSASRDAGRIATYAWEQLAGPRDASMVDADRAVANATSLTKGDYTFRLTVHDASGRAAADNVTVAVTQAENLPPKADGGGDKVLTLPLPILLLNGSRSSDDFRIVAWRWRRTGLGAAAGVVALASDSAPVLMLTDLVVGRYEFELTVTDDQGLADSDTVSVKVNADPLDDHLLEMTLNEPVSSFTSAQLESLTQKLTLLLGGELTVNVSVVRAEPDTDNVQLLLCLREKGTAVEGERALALVRGAGWGAGGGGGGGGGGAVVTRLRSLRCLSACSGRGVCDRRTRTCRCDAFWMQNLFTQLDPDAPPNCEWSVVYASLACAGALAGAAGACWAAVRGARRLCAAARRPPAPRTKYRLLPAHTREEAPFSNNASDTETDSDVLFESRGSRESSFSRRLLNGDAPAAGRRNGHKPQRKVRT